MSSDYHYEYYYGRSAFVKNGETLVKNYFDNPTQDYHGGRAAQHHAEARQIALQVIKEVVPQMIEETCVKICTAALEDVIGAIEWDIEEVVNVSFDDMHNEFNSEKFRKVISTKIMDSIMHSAAHSGRWCGGPAAAVRFKQRPKLVSYIRFNHHRVVLCCPL